jgi:hypothetical protein
MLLRRRRSHRLAVLPVPRLPAILALAAPAPAGLAPPPVLAVAATLAQRRPPWPPHAASGPARTSGHLTTSHAPAGQASMACSGAKDAHRPATDHLSAESPHQEGGSSLSRRNGVAKAGDARACTSGIGAPIAERDRTAGDSSRV